MITYRKVKRTLSGPLFKWALVLCITLTVGLMPAPAGALEILIGTGETGTFSYFSGRILERVISRHTRDITCKAIPGSGDMHNLTNLKQGSLDLALIDSRMLNDAINKAGNFKFLDIRYDNLRAIIPLYEVPLTLVVRADANINTADELKGKRINAGTPRSPRRLATATLMTSKNWSKTDFSLFAEISTSLSQDTMAFCHGTIQAMVHMGVHPDTSLQQVIQRCGAVLVGVNDRDFVQLVSGNPAFLMTRIQADTYPGQTEPVETLGTRTLLVASADLDEQTTYTIMDAIYNNRQRLQAAHPALSLQPVAANQKGVAGIELHPGAILYFSSH